MTALTAVDVSGGLVSIGMDVRALELFDAPERAKVMTALAADIPGGQASVRIDERALELFDAPEQAES